MVAELAGRRFAMRVGEQYARLRLFLDQNFEFRFGAPSDANTILPHLRTRFPHA